MGCGGSKDNNQQRQPLRHHQAPAQAIDQNRPNERTWSQRLREGDVPDVN